VTPQASLDALMQAEETTAPPRSLRGGTRLGDTFVLIFTSGTTGLPKAARVSHLRFIVAGETTARALRLGPDDVFYDVLPLFHGAGGMVPPSTSVAIGIPLVLRRKFSVSGFWPDVRRHRITTIQYVGEICRYLTSAPVVPGERDHTLRNFFGAGLRPDVWRSLLERFGVQRVVETWGGTETNCNLQNLDGPLGSCGRIPFPEKSNARLVRYDVAEDRYPRDERGFCIPCAVGEPGEMLGQIFDFPDSPAGRFEGYTSTEQSEARILRDVFAPGDRWYRTGDMLRCDADGYFWFVDRIGDTYRWKSENVSTEEVARMLSEFPGPLLVNVYGVKVPHAEGRAGMVALTYPPQGHFDPEAFYKFAAARLQPYAMPVFVRLSAEADMTASFKLRKVDLQREGYDPLRIRDPLFVLDAARGRYRPLDADALRDAGLEPFESSDAN
jgi:fatty-acyl-CoA synthase